MFLSKYVKKIYFKPLEILCKLIPTRTAICNISCIMKEITEKT